MDPRISGALRHCLPVSATSERKRRTPPIPLPHSACFATVEPCSRHSLVATIRGRKAWSAAMNIAASPRVLLIQIPGQGTPAALNGAAAITGQELVPFAAGGSARAKHDGRARTYPARAKSCTWLPIGLSISQRSLPLSIAMMHISRGCTVVAIRSRMLAGTGRFNQAKRRRCITR